MARFRFTAGRLLCGNVRTFLKKAKFFGYDIDFIESDGLFEREFIVKGSDQDIKSVATSIIDWCESNGFSK